MQNLRLIWSKIISDFQNYKENILIFLLLIGLFLWIVPSYLFPMFFSESKSTIELLLYNFLPYFFSFIFLYILSYVRNFKKLSKLFPFFKRNMNEKKLKIIIPTFFSSNEKHIMPFYASTISLTLVYKNLSKLNYDVNQIETIFLDANNKTMMLNQYFNQDDVLLLEGPEYNIYTEYFLEKLLTTGNFKYSFVKNTINNYDDLPQEGHYCNCIKNNTNNNIVIQTHKKKKEADEREIDIDGGMIVKFKYKPQNQDHFITIFICAGCDGLGVQLSVEKLFNMEFWRKDVIKKLKKKSKIIFKLEDSFQVVLSNSYDNLLSNNRGRLIDAYNYAFDIEEKV